MYIDQSITNDKTQRITMEGTGSTKYLLSKWGGLDPFRTYIFKTKEQSDTYILNLRKYIMTHKSIDVSEIYPYFIEALFLSKISENDFRRMIVRFTSNDMNEEDFLKDDNGNINEIALKYWRRFRMTPVCIDYEGNYLLYSLWSSKFYDYDHEYNNGNDMRWLKSGVTYDALINTFKNPEFVIESFIIDCNNLIIK